ncbi:MAG: hypothetical protein CR985_02700 [Flavobacteriales bacterium]|nr:MAG: hypothetical protein CR985_02700 [Flavobacteriales bacterium]
MEKSLEKKYNRWVIFLSVLIPLVVASLFGVKLDVKLPVFLPPVYAAINALTVVILVIAVWAVKNGKLKLHENLIKIALVFSACFLLLYVAHHITSEPTPYGGEGFIRYVYYFILITHILLSIVVIPFVLITFVRALTGNFVKHKKIARFTFPLWLYVAVSGVIVYVMIAPYYT